MSDSLFEKYGPRWVKEGWLQIPIGAAEVFRKMGCTPADCLVLMALLNLPREHGQIVFASEPQLKVRSGVSRPRACIHHLVELGLIRIHATGKNGTATRYDLNVVMARLNGAPRSQAQYDPNREFYNTRYYMDEYGDIRDCHEPQEVQMCTRHRLTPLSPTDPRVLDFLASRSGLTT